MKRLVSKGSKSSVARKVYICTLSLLAGGMLWAQTPQKVKGKVLDETGAPLIGATIRVVGANIGTIVNTKGEFNLNLPHNKNTITISFMGYKDMKVQVKDGMVIQMLPDTKALDDVVVVGYGTQKKGSFSGSAAVVGAKQLEARPISNAAQALSGSSPGVQVTTGGGQPGDGISIRIRGFGSLNASSSPLIIVDGSTYPGALSSINPADIESLTVLKDASSTAIYGSSAGNGVVLITTKRAKGEQSKPSISFTMSQGFSQRGIPEYDRLNPQQYYPAIWTQIYNSKRNDFATYDPNAATQASKDLISKNLKFNIFKDVPDDEVVDLMGQLNPKATTLLWGDDLDWEKALTRLGHRQEYGVNLNYRNNQVDLYTSIGYLKDNGYLIKTDYQRYSGRVNVNYKLNPWLKIGANVSLFRTRSNSLTTTSNTSFANPFYFSRVMGPIYPIHEHDLKTGEYKRDVYGNLIYDYVSSRPSGALSGRHIIAETQFNGVETKKDGMNLRTYVELRPIDGLKLTFNAASDINNYFSTDYRNRLVGDAKGSGRLGHSNYESTSFSLTQLAEYTRSLSDVHNIGLLVGHEAYKYTYKDNDGRRSSEIVDGMYTYSNFVSLDALNSSSSEYAKEGYFSRLNYDYDNKYYLTLSYRRDGSSKFERNVRWGNFYSIGASWRINKENWFQGVNWVDNLKLRASYGQTGNDGISRFSYADLFAIGWNNKENGGILLSQVGNPLLLWETQISSDIALEFGLWERFRGSIEYFNKSSRDLIFGEPQQPSSALGSINKNIGRIVNQGIEIDLSADIIRNKSFNWSIGGNATWFRSKITEMPKDNPTIVSGLFRYEKGHSIYDYYLRDYYGVDPADGTPLYVLDENEFTYSASKDRTINGKKLTTNQDRAKYEYSGSSIPKVYGGINTSIQWKDFGLSASFSYQLGGKSYDSNYQDLMKMNDIGAALHQDAWDQAWRKPGDVTQVPRLDLNLKTSAGANSNRWLISSDALLFKSLVLSYNLPSRFTKKYLGISALRISMAGENLYLWGKRKGLNPMESYSGISQNSYTASRSLTFNLNATL